MHDILMNIHSTISTHHFSTQLCLYSPIFDRVQSTFWHPQQECNFHEIIGRLLPACCVLMQAGDCWLYRTILNLHSLYAIVPLSISWFQESLFFVYISNVRISRQMFLNESLHRVKKSFWVRLQMFLLCFYH